MSFLFAGAMDQAEIMSAMEEHLAESPCDLVVIDSLSDLFRLGDLNDNSYTRRTYAHFAEIIQKHDVLIFFVHHTNKSTYQQRAHQANVQGAGSVVAKARAVFELKSAQSGFDSFLKVIKGNQISRSEKEQSYVLHFDEETFLFSNTGRKASDDEVQMRINQSLATGTGRDYLALFHGQPQCAMVDLKREAALLWKVREDTARKWIEQDCVRVRYGLYAPPGTVLTEVEDAHFEEELEESFVEMGEDD